MEKSKNNKKFIRKWLIPVVAATSFACLGIAAGCSKEPSYYKLTYSMPRGVELYCYHEDGERLDSGTEIREGYEVKFSLDINEYCEGTPTVYVNSDVVTPGEDNMYSFVMKRRTVISIDGVEYIPHYTVKFVSGGSRVWYEYEGAEVNDGFEVGCVTGDVISFKLRTSVYYKPHYEVLANTEVLSLKDGAYTFTCTEDTNITVHGLEAGDNFFSLEVDEYNALLMQANALASDLDSAKKAVSDLEGQIATLTAQIAALDPTDDAAEIAALTEQKTALETQKTTAEGERDGLTAQLAAKDSDVAKKENYILHELGKSADKPYQIKTPMDLYAMASFINDDWYAEDGYQYAYYRLENDINLDGEQLFVIGDGFNSSAYFCGHFNGNGHKITNFTLSDKLVDQEDFVDIYLASVGLFGYASASEQDSVEIFDLTLDSFTVDINAAPHVSSELGASLFVGSIAGRSLGAQIINCHANGTINVRGNINVSVFVGGLVGYSQAVGSAGYYSMLASCSSNVNVNAAGFVLAAGGIAGYLDSGNANVNANVLNCYSTGNTVGSVNAGGVVGYVGPYSSVQNCYSTGSVYASSVFRYRDSNTELYCYANAGGIAGFADYHTVIADCYSSASLNASAVEGKKYQKTGAIFANTTSVGSPYADALPAVKVGCVDNADDKADVIDNWSDGDWDKSGANPVVNPAEVAFTSFFITIKEGSTQKGTFEVKSYAPVSYWYLTTPNGLEEYLIDSDNRSYGYYFDEDCIQKVPSGYIPTHAVTFYVKYADYSEVAGTYYFTGATGVSLTLEEDGTLIYRDGALMQKSHYAYDGTTVVLYNTSLSYLSPSLEADAFEYTSFTATVHEGEITITDPEFFPAGSELVGAKSYIGFDYSGYYTADGNVYTFHENGRGSVRTGSGEKRFTFQVLGNSLTLRFTADGTTLAGKLSAGALVQLGNAAVYKQDKFAGVWKKGVTGSEAYEFDGMSAGGTGKWTYYFNGAVRETGEYTVESDGSIKGVAGRLLRATAQNGLITITDQYGDCVYKNSVGHLGVWKFNDADPITLILEGTDENGEGTGKLVYDGAPSLAVTYRVITESGADKVRVYARDILIGTLSYDAAQEKLTGSVAGKTGAQRSSEFALVTGYRGEWHFTSGGEPVTLVLDGEDENGNGSGSLAYDNTNKNYAITYAVKEESGSDVIYLTASFGQAGRLVYNTAQSRLEGVLYSEAQNAAAQTKFNLNNGYRGEWLFDDGAEEITLSLSGVDGDGKGSGVLKYGNGAEDSVSVDYSVDYETKTVTLIMQGQAQALDYGTLVYHEESVTLEGTVYSKANGALKSGAVFFPASFLTGAEFTAAQRENYFVRSAFCGAWRLFDATAPATLVLNGRGAGTIIYEAEASDNKVAITYEATATQVKVKSADGNTDPCTLTFNADEITLNGNLPKKSGGSYSNAKLVLSHESATSYGAGYQGVWRFMNKTEKVTLTLAGLNNKGVGTGSVRYAGITETVDEAVVYDVISVSGAEMVCVYTKKEGDTVAILVYNKQTRALEGMLYSLYLQSINVNPMRDDAVFCLRDEFYGDWTGDGDFASVNFNGFGLYNLKATDAHERVRGQISTATESAIYLFTPETQSGTFTLSGVSYRFVYDRAANVIVVFKSYSSNDAVDTVVTVLTPNN